MVLKVPLSLYEEMRSDVMSRAPEEACGFLAGTAGVAQAQISITNQLHSPARFRMDPVEQLKAFERIESAGLELLVIYHSHPQGPPRPSETDLAEFAYPGVTTLIWFPDRRRSSAWQVGAFDLADGKIQDVTLEVVK